MKLNISFLQMFHSWSPPGPWRDSPEMIYNVKQTEEDFTETWSDIKHPAQTQPLSSLSDINECANKTVCGEHAFCQNLIGTYLCVCDQGFTSTADGKTCVGACPFSVIQWLLTGLGLER